MATNVSTKKRINPNKLNLFLDLTIATAFVIALEVGFTGLRIHELLGLAFGAGILVHIILHWRWILNVTLHFFEKLFHSSRGNYVLNLALFVDALVMVITGIAISRTLGLRLGLGRESEFLLMRLHLLSSYGSLILVGLHVAVHWKWIVTHSQKYLFNIPFLQPRLSSPVVTKPSGNAPRA